MPTPWKPDYKTYGGSLGATVDTLKQFVGKLFDPNNHQRFRNEFFDDPNDQANSTLNEPTIRRMLKSEGINVPETYTDSMNVTHDIRIAIVDVQNARLVSYKKKKVPPAQQDFGREPIGPNDWFYLLVMPPIPSNLAEADLQTYESAWHHAIVDGYGM